MDKDQYDILLKSVQKLGNKVSGVEESVTRVENDLADDRKDIDDMKLRLSGVQESNKGIINTLTRFQKKTSESIKTGVAAGIEPIQKTMDDWVEKKVVRTRPQKRSIMEKIKDYLDSLTDWKKEVEENGK